MYPRGKMEEGPNRDLVEVFGWVEAACPDLRYGTAI